MTCLQQRLGVCVGKAGKNEEATNLLKDPLEIQEARLQEDDTRLADTLDELGVHTLKEDRHEEAMHSLRRALLIQEVTLGQSDRFVSRTLYQMGVCLQRMTRHDEAETLMQRALNIKETHVGEKSLVLAFFTLHEISVHEEIITRSEDREALLRYALKIEEVKLPNDDSQIGFTLFELGKCVQASWPWEETRAILTRALRIHESEEENGGRSGASTGIVW